MKYLRVIAVSAPVGIALWFFFGLQGSGVFGRDGEACVRFISLPLNRCSVTTDWLMVVDWAIWTAACAVVIVAVRRVLDGPDK
jgi:uncharacterized membrane protein